VRGFNELYWRRVPRDGREADVPFARFFCPLDSIHDWNRIYGRAGFHQFQCVLPHAEAPRGLRALLETLAQAGRASFLAVLKSMGPAGRGYLSFPMPGMTLALDFPSRSGVRELLATLEWIVLEHGGRIYLAKDSALSVDAFKTMYPCLAKFRAIRADIDPSGRLASDMARRRALL
jgi:decaprenylphospho-beta-D-ribofuranose 2-oxidase